MSAMMWFPRGLRHVFHRGAASHTPQPARNPAQATGPRIAPPDGRWPHKEPIKLNSMGMDLPPAGGVRGPLPSPRPRPGHRPGTFVMGAQRRGSIYRRPWRSLRVAPCARPIGIVFWPVLRAGAGGAGFDSRGCGYFFLSGGRLRRRWGSPGRGDPTSRRSCT